MRIPKVTTAYEQPSLGNSSPEASQHRTQGVSYMKPGLFMAAVATKNIVRIDSVDFFAELVVRSRHENYRPSPPVHPTRTVPEPRLLTPRNSGASPTAGDGEPGATQATPISLGSTAVLGLALPSVARVPANAAGF